MQRSWLRQMSHSQQAVKHRIYFIYSIPLAASTACLSQVFAYLQPAGIPSFCILPLCDHPPQFDISVVWLLLQRKFWILSKWWKKRAHLDYLKPITFLMESSHLAEIVQPHFSGMWFCCKGLNIVHHKPRCKTFQILLKKKMSSCSKLHT